MVFEGAKIYIIHIIKKLDFFDDILCQQRIFFASDIIIKDIFCIEKYQVLLFYNIIKFMHLFTCKFFTIERDL